VQSKSSSAPSRGSAFSAVVFIALFAGWASVSERNPLPEAASDRAIIPGVLYARLWGDELPKNWEQQVAERRAQTLWAASRLDENDDTGRDFLFETSPLNRTSSASVIENVVFSSSPIAVLWAKGLLRA